MIVAVMRPKLPGAATVVPYLERIDATRTYSNFGPLNTALEQRLSALYGVGEGCLTAVSNATVGLAVALAAMGCKPGSLCAMPAWTFIASAHAAMMAGMIPYFVDVDQATWSLDPAAVEKAIAKAPGEVGAVMPVAPFGRPQDMAAWEAFKARTGIAVVIDAAAGFDAVTPSAIPVVVSLHATKALGIGEGGFVVCTDTALIREIRSRSNFGFDSSRRAQMPATNGKLSEYHAAVGLAALDEWDSARAEWMTAADRYRQALSTNAMRLQPGFGDQWVGSACVLELARPEARRLEQAMAASGIETRRWWGDGAHRHPVTADLAIDPLPVTELLVEGTLAVPFYRDLTQEIVDKVASALLDTQS
jgi:dTDP-4-amino-4,6-dideoxygalactose transaminase